MKQKNVATGIANCACADADQAVPTEVQANEETAVEASATTDATPNAIAESESTAAVAEQVAEANTEEAPVSWGDLSLSTEGVETYSVEGSTDLAGLVTEALGGAEALSALKGFAEGLASFGGNISALFDTLKAVQANAATDHKKRVDRLAERKGIAFSKDELAAMTADQLEKLEQSITNNSRAADYSGRGGQPQANAADADWIIMQAPSTYEVTNNG